MRKYIAIILCGFCFLLPSNHALANDIVDFLSHISPHKPQVIYDESFAVTAQGARMQSFNFKRKTKVNFRVKGLKNAAKGFQVYVIPAKEWEHFRKGQRFTQYASFQGLNVIRYDKTAILPKGNIAFVVANKNNVMNPLHARAAIIVNPK